MEMAFALPKMVWMEVDTKNKELPICVADSAAALARLCGVTEANVRSSANHHKRTGRPRRFIQVWIDDED